MKTILKIAVLYIISINIQAQSLQSGDRFLMKCTTGGDNNSGYYTYPLGGGQLFTRSRMQEDNYQAFTIQKVYGGGEIRQNDKVYLKTDNNFFLNSYDSNGALSIINSHSDNPNISDEIFTIQFLSGNNFSNNLRVKFYTRRGLTIGIYNRTPSALPRDNRSDDGSDALIADNRPEKFVLVKTNTQPQVILYEAWQQTGERKVISSDWNVTGSNDPWNDRISSITVPRGCRIIVYEAINFEGASMELGEGSWSVSGGNDPWNDRISSIRVIKN